MDHTIFKVTIGILCLFFSEAALTTGCNDASVTCPANSKCDTDNDNCVCNDGFKIDGEACIAKVIGDPCDGTNGCTGLANTGCTDSTCECNTGYAEKDNVCTKILGSACTAQNENTVCSVTNSECKDDACACKVGYTGDATCSKILGSACTAQNENTVCSLPNTECKDDACACKVGYTGDPTCSKIIGSACTGSDACSGDENTICKDDKCECKEDYAEKNAVCILTVIGKDCSDTLKCEIDNAVCDTETSKCKCDADFMMNIDKCNPKNAAAMAGFGAIALSLSVLTARLMMF